jgi:hypothetical protein
VSVSIMRVVLRSIITCVFDRYGQKQTTIFRKYGNKEKGGLCCG